MKHLIVCGLAVVALALSFAACGGGNTSGADASVPADAPDAEAVAGADAAEPGPDAGPTDTPPTVSLESFAPFTLLKGAFPLSIKADDDLGVVKLEIFVGAATTPSATKNFTTPAGGTQSMYLATTALPEGATTIFVRATDTTGHSADSAKVPAVVCNQGQEAVLGEGNTGEVVIPAVYPSAVEVDTKHHWTNPTGVTKILGVLYWDLPAGATPWDLGLLVGWGECPDAGKALCNEVFSKTSPITVEAMPTGTDARTGMHFIHVRPNDAVDHKGGKLPYTVKVFFWK